VLGVPDERFGERVTALVVARPGVTLDEAEVLAWCRGRLAGYKRPKDVFVVESLERSAAGKANYPRLRGLVAELASARSAAGSAVEASPG
jgi:acyl-CoA synthetase (AMP-forming)/AMP-acid ligase II